MKETQSIFLCLDGPLPYRNILFCYLGQWPVGPALTGPISCWTFQEGFSAIFYSSLFSQVFFWCVFVCLGLSCSTRDLLSSLQPEVSFWVVAHGMFFRCSVWDLVPWPGMESRPPPLGACSPNHWITREVPLPSSLESYAWDWPSCQP